MKYKGIKLEPITEPQGKVLADKDKDIVELKNEITLIQSDKTLQERLNEVCNKHGVSTLQDLDWALCESEKRQTKYCIESIKMIARHKYKRCLAMSEMCAARYDAEDARVNGCGACCEYKNKEMKFWERWRWRWDAIAYKLKENKQ